MFHELFLQIINLTKPLTDVKRKHVDRKNNVPRSYVGVFKFHPRGL